jgi:hypothetical protein
MVAGVPQPSEEKSVASYTIAVCAYQLLPLWCKNSCGYRTYTTSKYEGSKVLKYCMHPIST